MDVRPDRLHQIPLAENASGTGGEYPQHLEGLGPELDGRAVGRAQFRPLQGELKSENRSTLSPPGNSL